MEEQTQRPRTPYLKMMLFALMAVGIFSYFKMKADIKGKPVPELISTSTTLVSNNSINQIIAEAEIKNNGGEGYIVLEVKAAAGDYAETKTVDSFLKSKKTQTIQVIFDNQNLVEKEPDFQFNVTAFITK